MAKRIRLSDDSGTTYYTLPGNTGELRNEAGEIVDTIFGQDFQSTQPGLIGWSITSNALYKGFAGYVATIKRQGTTTAFTGESTTQVGATQTYQIDDATRQIWDRSVALSVLDNGGAVAAADIESIDYLFGRVTFDSGYSVTGPVTVTGSFFPTTDLCGANSFTLTQTAAGVDITDMCTAQGNQGHRVWDYGLKNVSMEMSGFYNLSYGYLAQLQSRSEWIIEINPDGGGESVARGFFRTTAQSQSGPVGEPEEESVTFKLSVPDDDLLETPFKWVQSGSTTLNQAVQIALTAWQDSVAIDAQYLGNGTAGEEGSVIVTEISLSGGLEAMNEFSVTLQGTGQTTTV